MKVGDKVKVKEILFEEVDPDDGFLFTNLIGEEGKIVGIAPETCCGLPSCPYNVEIKGEVYFMDASELEVIK